MEKKVKKPKKTSSNGFDEETNAEGLSSKEFLKKSKPIIQGQKEAIRSLYSKIKEKPNADILEILKAKAMILALILLSTIISCAEFWRNRKDQKNLNNKAKEKSINPIELYIEITSIYLSIIERVISPLLNGKESEVFMKNLEDELFTTGLWRAYGENSPLTKDAFISNLNKRLAIYKQFPFTAYGSGGTLLREWTNNVEKIVGIDRRVFFTEFITYTVLRDIDILQLEKLLNKEGWSQN